MCEAANFKPLGAQYLCCYCDAQLGRDPLSLPISDVMVHLRLLACWYHFNRCVSVCAHNGRTVFRFVAFPCPFNRGSAIATSD